MGFFLGIMSQGKYKLLAIISNSLGMFNEKVIFTHFDTTKNI